MEQVRRLLPFPEQSFFLFGPRGTGKTTWIKTQMKPAVTVDLLDPATLRTYEAHPESLKEVVGSGRQKRVVFIDEIQKCPSLLDVVHWLIEEKLGIQFVLTGSSARKIKRAGVNLLAGRAILRTLHPFMAAELGAAFDLDTAIHLGLLPLVCGADMPEKSLQSYVGAYLEQEVKAEGLVRNAGAFGRFLEAASFSHGSVLNISNVARECQVERKTVEGYFSIVEDLLLAYRIPVFTKRAARAVVQHPKFYFFDAGVFCSLRPRSLLDRPEEIEGQALEGLVGQHLRAWAAYRDQGCRIHFWRTSSGAEVDFILHGAEGLWAIEVKNAARVRPEDLKSLRAFREDYPEATAILLYRGAARLEKEDGILCLPIADFLRHLHPESPMEKTSPRS